MTLVEKLKARTARVCVIGQGYVGLPLAVEFAQAGFSVTGIDLDVERVTALNAGQSYIPDVESTRLQAMLAQGRYAASADLTCLGDADAIVICVPTPLRKSKDPDISFVLSAANEVAQRMRAGQLIVLESTTYPGTTDEVLLPMFEGKGLSVGRDFFLAFSPERIDPGNQRFKVQDIPKVVGGVTAECTKVAGLLYGQIVGRVFPVSSTVVAELAKLYENTFRSVNIALANEFALMCRHLGVSVWEVIDAAATKPFGFMPFYPGPGIGGHCIPIDPMYLSWKVRLNGYEARFIGLADEITRSMPRFAISLLGDALNERGKAIKGTRVLVLGVAYKRGVGDVRESPALEIVAELGHKGAFVEYADPYVPELVTEGLHLKRVDATPELLRQVDAVMIVTDHPEFDYARIVSEAPLVVDTRGVTRGLPVPAGRVVQL
jgi:UDP-N-acetyl-D-glucosamine dehydrogenase